jgi:hypothetical protein
MKNLGTTFPGPYTSSGSTFALSFTSSSSSSDSIKSDMLYVFLIKMQKMSSPLKLEVENANAGNVALLFSSKLFDSAGLRLKTLACKKQQLQSSQLMLSLKPTVADFKVSTKLGRLAFVIFCAGSPSSSFSLNASKSLQQ